MRKYFDDGSNFLRDELVRYIRHCQSKFRSDEFYLPPTPMKVHSESGELNICFHFHLQTQTTVLFLEEATRGFAGIGLTKRESDVLLWISKGKTDAEIGLLLKISARTVQKHVEHIFNKLGVETRTAAMSYTVTSIQGI